MLCGMFVVYCGGERYIPAVVSRMVHIWPSSLGAQTVAAIRRTAAILPERVVHLVEGTIGIHDLRALRDADLRVGIAVASVLGELAIQSELRDGLPWVVDLGLDPGQLAVSVGATRMEVTRAIAMLLSAQVMLYSPGVSGADSLSRRVLGPVAAAACSSMGESSRTACSATATKDASSGTTPRACPCVSRSEWMGYVNS